MVREDQRNRDAGLAGAQQGKGRRKHSVNGVLLTVGMILALCKKAHGEPWQGAEQRSDRIWWHLCAPLTLGCGEQVGDASLCRDLEGSRRQVRWG